MFDFSKKITKGKYADVEDKIEEMLKKKGLKTEDIFWNSRFFYDDSMKHMHQATIYVVDLKTKEITTEDVAKYGSHARICINHINSGTVTFNDETNEIILRLKKDGDESECKSTISDNERV